jgi:hypothetical protein
VWCRCLGFDGYSAGYKFVHFYTIPKVISICTNAYHSTPLWFSSVHFLLLILINLLFSFPNLIQPDSKHLSFFHRTQNSVTTFLIISFCTFRAYSVLVHVQQTRHNIQVTGQDPVRIITQQMFVEQETNWQRYNYQQRKIPLVYNNL